MFLNGNALNGETLDTDICIIGGGVAGIAIARELMHTGHSVVILESGKTYSDHRTQQLAKGKSAGRSYNLSTSRVRMFGGSSNHWEGMCCTLDDMDFKRRDWVRNSGWPITQSDVSPYYKGAADFLNLSNKASDDFTTPQDLLPENDLFTHSAWRIAHTLKPAEAYHSALDRAQNIRVILNSNVQKIITQDGGKKARTVDVRTLDGQQFHVSAKRFIIACGGIENARLLLLSDNLGNRYDQVGRYFMEHPRLPLGTLHTFAGTRHTKPFEQFIGMDEPDKIYNITPTEQLAHKEKLLNSALVVRDVKVTNKVPSVVPYMARMLQVERPQYAKMTLFGRVEHAPCPGNRVTLSNEKDALGQRQSRLHVRITGQEWETMRSTATLLSSFLSANNIGLLKLHRWMRPLGRWPEHTLWSGHHIGTTRMSDYADRGVVDRNCKIHGVDNVYVAGSSVFCTSGWANPTYTLTALALRLADHLKSG